MKKLFSKIGILAVIVFALTACYPGGAEYVSDTDIVVTDYDEQYNFGAVKTYWLSDSIQHITDDDETANTSMDEFILTTLASYFDALGWEQIIDSTAAEPDVAVVVAAIEVENYNYYTMPWYPGWGWGWYWKSTGETNYWGYPGYGWGYPPYYGGAYISSYSTGTVGWNLFDPKLVDEENEDIIVQWVGAINGVLGTSTSTTESRIQAAINQAFYQSPYLSE